MSQIPDQARGLVLLRDRYLCQRCGMKGTDWHHRRRRNIEDEHTHHPCNGVLLCRTCHGWVHANPFLARGSGLIVPTRIVAPGEVPVETYLGLLRFDCMGGFVWADV